jgi:hypothetical protein
MRFVAATIFCTILVAVGGTLNLASTLNPSAPVSVVPISCSITPLKHGQTCLDETIEVLSTFRSEQGSLPDTAYNVLNDRGYDVSKRECVETFLEDLFNEVVFIPRWAFEELVRINKESDGKISATRFRSLWNKSEYLSRSTDACRMHLWYYYVLNPILAVSETGIRLTKARFVSGLVSSDPDLFVVLPPPMAVEAIISAELKRLEYWRGNLAPARDNKRKRSVSVLSSDPPASKKPRFSIGSVSFPIVVPESSSTRRSTIDEMDRDLLKRIRIEMIRLSPMDFLLKMFKMVDGGSKRSELMEEYYQRILAKLKAPDEVHAFLSNPDAEIGSVLSPYERLIYTESFWDPFISSTEVGIEKDFAFNLIYTQTQGRLHVSRFWKQRILKLEKHRIVALVLPPGSVPSSSSSSVISPPSRFLRMEFPLIHKPDPAMISFLITILKRISSLVSVDEFIALSADELVSSSNFVTSSHSLSAKLWTEEILRFFRIPTVLLKDVVREVPPSNVAFFNRDNSQYNQAHLNLYMAFATQYCGRPLGAINVVTVGGMTVPPIDVIQRIAFDLVAELTSVSDDDL